LHPAPNVRDDRETPLLRARDICLLDLICHSEKQKYFCKGGLTGFADLPGFDFARVPDAAQRRLAVRRTAGTHDGTTMIDGPRSAAHHFVLRSIRARALILYRRKIGHRARGGADFVQ
jgi:hypothetical protein